MQLYSGLCCTRHAGGSSTRYTARSGWCGRVAGSSATAPWRRFSEALRLPSWRWPTPPRLKTGLHSRPTTSDTSTRNIISPTLPTTCTGSGTGAGSSGRSELGRRLALLTGRRATSPRWATSPRRRRRLRLALMWSVRGWRMPRRRRRRVWIQLVENMEMTNKQTTEKLN